MAFMPFYLGEGGNRYSEIEAADKALKNPLTQRWGR
jgi:hypothetical protein